MDRLLIELDATVSGPTYTLYFASKTHDPTAFSGLTWLPVFPDVSPVDVRCFPELGPGYMESLLGAYDDAVRAEMLLYAWAEPYSAFRILQMIP